MLQQQGGFSQYCRPHSDKVAVEARRPLCKEALGKLEQGGWWDVCLAWLVAF